MTMLYTRSTVAEPQYSLQAVFAGVCPSLSCGVEGSEKSGHVNTDSLKLHHIFNMWDLKLSFFSVRLLRTLFYIYKYVFTDKYIKLYIYTCLAL